MVNYILFFFSTGPFRQPNWSPLDSIHGIHQKPEGLIVGGSEANINNFRYQLSLRFNNNHICGASAISNRFALSAAHCIVTFSVASVSLTRNKLEFDF